MGLYREKLNRVFLGNAPAFLLDIPEDLVERALALQGIHYKYGEPLPPEIIKVNPNKLIQDCYELDKERLQKQPDIPMEVRQRAVGTWMRSEFYEWMQDPNKDNWQKLYLCVYYRSLLMAFVRTYDMEVIDNQLSFVKEIVGTEAYYTKLIEDEVAPFLAWEKEQQQKANKPFELSPLWPYGIDKLKELSTELKLSGFTSNDLDFASAFDISRGSKCNWQKPITTLVFLCCFLFSPGKSDIPAVILLLLEKRFLVKGKPLTKKLIQTTFSNIRPHINKREEKLTGEYATVYEAYKSTIP